jgi:hypothetical protein
LSSAAGLTETVNQNFNTGCALRGGNFKLARIFRADNKIAKDPDPEQTENPDGQSCPPTNKTPTGETSKHF